MLILKEQPTLADLHDLIKRVDKYPVSVKGLIRLAEEAGYPLSVIDFYNSFPQDEIFEDADDLWARTEQVEMLHHETAPANEMDLDEP